MSWVMDHSQVLTAAAIFAVPFAFALFIGYLYRNTPEQPKEQATKTIEVIEGVGKFPAGAYIHVSPDGDSAVLATAETHNAIADGKGGYIK